MISFFAKNLKVLRQHYRFSQDELAKRLNIGRNKIASYEGRSIEPKLSLLIEMSHLFEVTLDDMITRDINLYNIDDLKARYHIMRDMDNSTKYSTNEVDSLSEITPEVFQEFNTKTDSVIKMAEGFRAYSSLYNEDEVRHPATIMANNVLKVLDHLITANKMLINEYKKHINKNN